MKLFDSYPDAFQYAMESRSFAAAALHRLKLPMSIDTTGCCKLFYFSSGNKKFHIDDQCFDIQPGDLFWINQYQWHYFSEADPAVDHHRFVLFIHPAYLKSLSTESTDLCACFSGVCPGCRLQPAQQKRFSALIEQIGVGEAYGSDVLSLSAFLAMMVFANGQYHAQTVEGSLSQSPVRSGSRELTQIRPVLQYINEHIAQDLSLGLLCNEFFLSSSYLCRIFKNATGTTVHKYIIAKRITLAKQLLSRGSSVTDACIRSGFRDYSSFLRCFVQAVGVTPKKYAGMEK